MHFEFLVEDLSGKKALDILVPKILDNDHSFSTKAYKGIGRIPKGLSSNSEPKRRILLDQLPRLLQGYGQTFANYPAGYSAVVFVICDLDDRCLSAFRDELLSLLSKCTPAPETRFCIAIEEGEAWFLGDLNAIKNAYPQAKMSLLRNYSSDSICGTWETMADALYPGGSTALKALGWKIVGQEKSFWAEQISPNMDIEQNDSASFCYFRDKIKSIIA